MSNEKVFAIDDEEDILELLKFNLSREGFQVLCAGSGKQAVQLVRSEYPDLIILDLMLPDMDGLEITRRLKNDADTRNIPIVMLTAKGEEADIVTGLELGADDYITKPFSPRILVARVRAVLRRNLKGALEQTSVIRIHDLQIDPRRHEVLLQGDPVKLTFTEFAILNYIARRPGWVFTRSQIVEAVRGEDYTVTDRSVDVQIVGLRKKLGSAGSYIETVRGIGYRFRE
ncbi:MAG: ArsR family transcriptional regulator [delta proteobacterium ML8_D]|nr:MAG: ArsR family transcriptional regulator [delta proteobacterium ML8_D]